MRRIVFHTDGGFVGMHHESDPEDFEDDVTDADLDAMAEEFMHEILQPEAWWTEVEAA